MITSDTQPSLVSEGGDPTRFRSGKQVQDAAITWPFWFPHGACHLILLKAAPYIVPTSSSERGRQPWEKPGMSPVPLLEGKVVLPKKEKEKKSLII